MQRFISLGIGILFFLTASFLFAAPIDKLLYYTKKTSLAYPSHYTIRFSLYDAPTDGNEIWFEEKAVTLTSSGTIKTYLGDVAPLDSVDFSEQLWVQAQRKKSDGSYKSLGGRVQFTVVPYALYAPNVGSFTGWGLTGNIGTNPSTNFLGTLDNNELSFRVNDTVGLRIIPTSHTPNIIGGSSSNTFIDGVIGGVIGGGGNSTEPNTVTDCYSTIGGGAGNSAGDGYGANCGDWGYSTVGGGHGNRAHDFYSTVGGGSANNAFQGSTIAGGTGNSAVEYSTVGGGAGNHASLWSTVAGGSGNSAGERYSTIGGGYDNIAGSYATIAGGHTNTASGGSSMIPGGVENVAAGDFSFAAGVGARANNQGCFVWSDNSDYTIPTQCNNDNRWVARASGGVYFYTNSGLTSGVYVAAGGGSWSSVSDRNMKANFAPVDSKDVLIRLASVPIGTWNYTTQDASVRHMGPTAQDLHAAFGLGESDKHINTIDAEGVALASIQGLYKVLQEKDQEIRELREQIRNIQRQLAATGITGGKHAQK